VLPIEQVGQVSVRLAEEMTQKEKERALEAAKGVGVGIRPADTREADAAAAKFATAQVDYIYEQPPEELFQSLSAEIRRHPGISCAAGVGGRRTRRAYDRNGFAPPATQPT
jgi:hypothetical protein